MVIQTPERRSNSQPCNGHVTISPSTRPSQRLPPLWAHSLPMAKISSPRLKIATSIPRTTRSSTPPGGRAARSRTRVRVIAPSFTQPSSRGFAAHLEPRPSPPMGERDYLEGGPPFLYPSPLPSSPMGERVPDLPSTGRGLASRSGSLFCLPLPSGERAAVRAERRSREARAE